jgi:Xaa-Pro aminopeptidase
MKEPLYKEFPLSEYKNRIMRARDLMDTYGFDALILTEEENLRYFTGYRTIYFDVKPDFQMFILPRNESSDGVLILPLHLTGVSHLSCIDDIRHWKGEGPESENDFRSGPINTVVDTLKDLRVHTGKMGMELGAGSRLAMNQMQFETLRENVKKGTLADCSILLSELRSIKSPLEIETMREACNITAAGYEAGLKSLKEGISEQEVCNIMCAEMINYGGSFNGFGYKPWMVFFQSGPTLSWCDAMAKDLILNKGDMFLVDGGAHYKGYYTDIMRMGSIGEPKKEKRKMYDTSVAANDAAIDSIKPGVSVSAVAQAGFDVIGEAGYHNQVQQRIEMGYDIGGHGLGLSVHENPIIRLSNNHPLREGMVFALEFFVSDALPFDKMNDFICIEQNVVVTSNGCDVLSTMSKKLYIA